MLKNILGFLLLFLPFSILSCSNDIEYVSITTIHDGDTFSILDQRYRLFGVDTPEMGNQYLSHENTKGLEYFYALEALKFSTRFISDNRCFIEEVTMDQYGRKVVKLKSDDGKDLGIELIKNGLARVAYISNQKGSPFFTNDTNYYGSLLQAQLYSYQNEFGIWKDIESFDLIFPKQI